MDVSKTNDQKYILIESSCKDNNETQYLPADKPKSKPKLIEKRQGTLKYSVAHIQTNKDAKDYSVMVATDRSPGKKNWKPFIPAIPRDRITGIDVFKDSIAIVKRQNGRPGIEIYSFANSKAKEIIADETVYSMGPSANPEFDASSLRFSYSSPVTPQTTYELDTRTFSRKLLKQDEVRRYDPKLYVTERIFASASDGVRIPIGLVYR